MSKVIDLGSRLKVAFGYVAANESDSLRKQNFSKDNGITSSNVFVQDASFEEMVIRNTDLQMMSFGNMLTATSGTQFFAPPPMISFSRGKKLIITEIDGTDAEVVERYGTKSWDIKLQGVLVDMAKHQFPKAEVRTMNEFFEVDAALVVESELFDTLGIKNMYVTDFEIAGVAGYADTMQYTLSARSIKPIEFFFLKNNN
ncbi:DUF6046 domain-containing protein [Pedobacter sp. WC2423]|uniref:DUF6046 domain-containing protein n=1 Tax=Pedobacter sp. WC2423 TaxID=3234142 RepID=UPI0034678445